MDPTGALDDIIDIEKSTGKISITEAEGNDEVRLVDDGEVVESYTYGENGSFLSENRVVYGETKTGISSTSILGGNTEKLQTFFEFAAQANVEFGKLDVEIFEGVNFSVVTTTHEEKVTSSLPGLAKLFSDAGFTGIKQTHSHPDGQSVPSGYYDNIPGNPYRLTPLPKSHRDYKKGDAQNARQTRSLPGFENTQFEVYNPKDGTRTIYDGVNKAKIKKR